MKKTIIHQINQSLLERFPGIWNVRLVWMMLIALLIHFLFYVAGYFTFINPESLQEYMYDHTVVATNGALLFSVAISIVMLVLWMVFLFKNNAFKNFYPSSNAKIFLNFWYFLLIIFVSSTFYVSYILGYKSYINKAYPAAQIEAQRVIAAKGEPFLVTEFENYVLSQKYYPAPFDRLERRENYDSSILFKGPAIFDNGKWIQFYETKRMVIHNTNPERDSLLKQSANSYYDNDSVYLDLVVKVYDVESLVDKGWSIYNFSNYSFLSDQRNVNDLYLKTHDANRAAVIASTYKLLESKDANGIKKVMNDFLALAKVYKIKTNLNTESWMTMVFKPERFKVDTFISKTRYVNPSNAGIEVADAAYAAEHAAAVAATDAVYSEEDSRFYDLYSNKISKNYFEITQFENVFENLTSLREWNAVVDFLYVSIWIAFGIASVVFVFRMTSLKAVIFAAVTAGLLGILVAIFALFNSFNGSGSEFSISYFLLFLSLAVIILPILLGRGMSKQIRAIFMNLTIVFIVPMAFLVVAIISLHQERAYRARFGDIYNRLDHPSLIEMFGLNWNWILLGFGLLFMLFYAAQIKKWKSLPEG